MGKRIDVTPGFCVLWALLLLLLPLRLLAAAMAAALFHELCHALMIRMLGGHMIRLTIGAGGMEMETTAMTAWAEAACALAGPAGSFLLAGLYRWFPYLALCAFVQGCYNLIPLYPLDGGRTLACLLRMAAPLAWEWILRWSEILVLLLLLAAALCLRMGWGPVALWGMLAMRKIPCKDHRFGVE